MTALEKVVRTAWIGWGNYAKHTRCSGCGEQHYCRAKAYGSRWLCLDCFDQKR